MALGDKYAALITHSHAAPLADGTDNKFVRAVRLSSAWFEALDKLCQEWQSKAFDLDSATGEWLSLIGGFVGVQRNGLTDADFKKVIRLKLLANDWNGTVGKTLDALLSVYPTASLDDARDMTMNIGLPWDIGATDIMRTLARIVADMFRPTTVGVVMYVAGQRLFAWDTTAPTVAGRGGWDIGYWGTTL